ncbi:MAG: efflux RND transporter periplasmic adaptor subunit [Hyphomicrobiaceae bacterium]|nr:efflux RND transporter periplasmic adaptor subunit [Hyphomicrobiaceae bacterium]
MLKVDSTISTIAVAFVAAAAVGAILTWQPSSHSALANPGQTAQGMEAARKADPTWAASATGRVEPSDGEVRIVAPVNGPIAEVLVDMNDFALKGDLLVRLDDADHLAKIAAATAEVDVRRRERDEEKGTVAGAALERRKAEDALDAAERDLFAARQAFDKARSRAVEAGGQAAADLVNLRVKVSDRKAEVADARSKLAEVESRAGLPLPDRLEAALTQSRADLRLAYQALERTRVRAPTDGTVLRSNAKVGEVSVVSPEAPLLTFANLSALKVRAEVEERDINKITVGQKAVVRADAYPNQEFTGTVTAIASALGAAHITTRGPRRPADVDVLEVIVTLDSGSQLVTGLRVDVFFSLQETAQAPARK